MGKRKIARLDIYIRSNDSSGNSNSRWFPGAAYQRLTNYVRFPDERLACCV